jgi:hypothetical protein
MQFFNVLEKNCYRYRAAAAMIFSNLPQPHRSRNDFFKNLSQRGSAAMDISAIQREQLRTCANAKYSTTLCRELAIVINSCSRISLRTLTDLISHVVKIGQFADFCRFNRDISDLFFSEVVSCTYYFKKSSINRD